MFREVKSSGMIGIRAAIAKKWFPPALLLDLKLNWGTKKYWPEWQMGWERRAEALGWRRHLKQDLKDCQAWRRCVLGHWTSCCPDLAAGSCTILLQSPLRRPKRVQPASINTDKTLPHTTLANQPTYENEEILDFFFPCIALNFISLHKWIQNNFPRVLSWLRWRRNVLDRMIPWFRYL